MSNNNEDYKPRNFRIISHATRNRILHVEDALAIRQIRFDLWSFSRGRGSQGQAEAYVDADEARLLFTELATGTLRERFQSIGGSRRDDQVVARVITVEEVEANNPVKITIQNGPGIPQQNGLITPSWWGDKGAKPEAELAVLLDRRTARKIALAVLTHLNAWATATYYQRVSENTWQPPQETIVDPETGEIVS
jgi:hypothetical protein